MLKGEYEFFSVGITLRAVAGSLVYVPKGTLHAHKNIGEGVGRMLVVQTPGGLYERSFATACSKVIAQPCSRTSSKAPCAPLLAVVLLPPQGTEFSTSALPPPRRTGSAAACTVPPGRKAMPVAAPISGVEVKLCP